MSESIRITNPVEIVAIKAGEIEGEAYSDGECWADVLSLIRWRNRMPLAMLEASVRATAA